MDPAQQRRQKQEQSSRAAPQFGGGRHTFRPGMFDSTRGADAAAPSQLAATARRSRAPGPVDKARATKGARQFCAGGSWGLAPVLRRKGSFDIYGHHCRPPPPPPRGGAETKKKNQACLKLCHRFVPPGGRAVAAQAPPTRRHFARSRPCCAGREALMLACTTTAPNLRRCVAEPQLKK